MALNGPKGSMERAVYILMKRTGVIFKCLALVFWFFSE